MAYSVSVKTENHAIATALKALLLITKTESYPNGNSGYEQSEIRRYERELAPFGVQLEKVYSGNAVTVGVYKFTAAENADTTAVRKFVINELRHWCANRQNLSRFGGGNANGGRNGGGRSRQSGARAYRERSGGSRRSMARNIRSNDHRRTHERGGV